MSKARAQRRAEREAAAAQRHADAARRAARAARWASRRQTLRERLPRRTRWRRHQGLLARRRRVQNAVVAGLFLAVQAIVWLVTDDPWVRAASLLLGVLSLPVLVTLAFDRRP